jgi:predicted nucleic-acid-binding protein
LDVETFDTNVLVRLLVSDDADQCQRAERVWRAAVTSTGAYVSLVVLVELVWVLRSAYKFDRVTIVGALRRLISSEGVVVQDDATVLDALREFEQGSADFSDYVILETARRAGALPVRTFDERLARASGAALVP